MFGIVYWDLHKQSKSDPWQMAPSAGLTTRRDQLRLGGGLSSRWKWTRFVSCTRPIRKNFKCTALHFIAWNLEEIADGPAFILGHCFVPRLLFLLSESMRFDRCCNLLRSAMWPHADWLSPPSLHWLQVTSDTLYYFVSHSLSAIYTIHIVHIDVCSAWT